MSTETEKMEHTRYLTADEELAAAASLHTREPFCLYNITDGPLSLALYHGGMKFNGCSYTYIPEHDECVRDDVLRLALKMRKKRASKEASRRQATADLF